MTTVLIVEDNPANMKLAGFLLEGAGYQVLRATDALTGIDMAKAYMPDLILMDIQLPGMDGLAATRLLRADSSTRQIRIIALTAYAMKGDRERILDMGFEGYIAKPIRYQEFLREVEAALAAPMRSVE